MMAKCGQSRFEVYVDLAEEKNCEWKSNKCTNKMGLKEACDFLVDTIDNKETIRRRTDNDFQKSGYLIMDIFCYPESVFSVTEGLSREGLKILTFVSGKKLMSVLDEWVCVCVCVIAFSEYLVLLGKKL